MLVLLAVGSSGESGGLVAAFAELAAVFCVSNLILKKWKKTAHIVNGVLLLLFNAQMLVLLFGGTFISQAMITNLDSLEDLGGKTFIYGTGVVLVLCISLLPSQYVDLKHLTWSGLLSAVLALELIFTLVCGNSFSPFYAYNDFRNKPEDLPEKPNVVIVFTEGLSQNIVEDERNIMPNVADMEKRSLFFENYYNHTFPTYKGLIGQLFSGYQLNNFDDNTLVSLEEAFRKAGYHTSVINTEPQNLNFASYLESLRFDEVVTNTDLKGEGISGSLTDKQAYEVLFDKVDDSGQFGKFMEELEQSDMIEDTIVIFTADHCTYADSDFSKAFPDYLREHPECDVMPLLIYYQGMKPETINVNGRNSLDFTPTVLDYLDMRIGNYFLGFTLFADNQMSANMNSFDRIFSDAAYQLSTLVGCRCDSLFFSP